MKVINEIKEKRERKQFEEDFIKFFADKLNLELGNKRFIRIDFNNDGIFFGIKKHWYNLPNYIAKIDFWYDPPRIELYGECHIEKFEEAIKEWEDLHKGKQITLIIKKGDC